MSEMLSYAPDLRSITGGQGEFTMDFERYEEVPGTSPARSSTRPGRRRRRSRPDARRRTARAAGLVRSHPVNTRDIRTTDAHTSCDVCGRTLLRGERAEIYINGGARRSVCELCTLARAARGLDPRGHRAPERRPRGPLGSPPVAARPPAPRRERDPGRELPSRRADYDDGEPEPAPRATTSLRRVAAARSRPAPARGARQTRQRERVREPRHVPRDPDQRRAQDRLGGRAVQRLRAPPHDRRRRPLAGRADDLGAAGRRRREPGQPGRLVGAVLVPLRGRPVRRGSDRAPERAGLRARRARVRRAHCQRGRPTTAAR